LTGNSGDLGPDAEESTVAVLEHQQFLDDREHG
jgi:hypothetical protein